MGIRISYLFPTFWQAVPKNELFDQLHIGTVIITSHAGMTIERYSGLCKGLLVLLPPRIYGRLRFSVLETSYDDYNRYFGIAKAQAEKIVHGFIRSFIALDDVDEQVDTSSVG